MNRNNPILYIVIPCYNEEKVLPYTNPMFIEKIESLINTGQVHPNRSNVVTDPTICKGKQSCCWDCTKQKPRTPK